MIVNCKLNIRFWGRLLALLLAVAIALPVQPATKKSSKKKAKEEQVSKTKATKKSSSKKSKSSKKNKKDKSTSSKKSKPGKDAAPSSKKKSKSRSEQRKQQAKRKAEQKAEQKVKEQSSRFSNDYDGIDVSSYQKDIDWDKVCRDKKIRFVYVKATEGATYTSPHFRYNIENARKHGLKVGSYHFLRTTSSLQSQFENFIRSVKIEEQDLVPLIDIEQRGTWTPKQIVDSLKAFAGMIRKHYNCRPMIYTMTSFYNKYLATHISEYPLFIARYSESAPELADNVRYTLWQYTDQGSVDGIDHAVDMCRFAKGVHLADISVRQSATKLSEHDLAMNVVEVPRPAASDNVNHAMERADTTQIDLTKLSKKELKERERKLKEQQKEEQRRLKAQKREQERQRKLREKAVKDSIKLAKKREKAVADSLKRAQKSALAAGIASGEHSTAPGDGAAVDSGESIVSGDDSIQDTGKSNAPVGDNESVEEISDEKNPADTVANRNQSAKPRPEKGSTYKKQYSTRRDKD